MNRTEIEWVRNPDGGQGFAWNPVTGCLKRCPYCYAWKLADGRLRSRYLANSCLPSHDEPDHDAHHLDPFYPRFWPSRVRDPLKHRNPAGIFVCDMGDLFGDWVPFEWQRAVFQTIEQCPQHRFYLLTKQPQNLAGWNPYPDNCFVGVSVTADGDITLAVTNLANIKAGKRFISFEPLLGSVSMTSHLFKGIVDWVIIGAQTKPTLPPRVEWVKEIVDAADRAGAPVFLKNNLKPGVLWKYISGKDEWALNKPSERAANGLFRQETPLETSGV